MWYLSRTTSPGWGGGGGVPKEFPGERFVVVFLLKGTLAPRYSSRIRKILSPEVPGLRAPPLAFVTQSVNVQAETGGKKTNLFPPPVSGVSTLWEVSGVGTGGNRWEQVGTGGNRILFNLGGNGGGNTPKKRKHPRSGLKQFQIDLKPSKMDSLPPKTPRHPNLKNQKKSNRSHPVSTRR